MLTETSKKVVYKHINNQIIEFECWWHFETVFRRENLFD